MQKVKGIAPQYILRVICIWIAFSPATLPAEGIRDIQQGEILAFVDARRAVLELEVFYAPTIISANSKREAIRMRKEFFKNSVRVIDETPGISYSRYNQIILLAQKSKTIRSIIKAAHQS